MRKNLFKSTMEKIEQFLINAKYNDFRYFKYKHKDRQDRLYRIAILDRKEYYNETSGSILTNVDFFDLEYLITWTDIFDAIRYYIEKREKNRYQTPEGIYYIFSDLFFSVYYLNEPIIDCKEYVNHKIFNDWMNKISKIIDMIDVGYLN